jgi:hypothetical protein
MIGFKPHAFSELRAWAARKRHERRLQKEKEKTIRESAEVVVDVTDPRIRQVAGYRKKLGPAVEAAMRFADALVEALPGPIEVGKETWATNPYVKAFFASVDEIQEVLRTDRELEAFFNSQPVTECYALLTMRKRERTVFGTEQIGEIIRREVAKTAVSFVDHRLVSLCRTEAETRAGLKAQTLLVLSDYASEKLVSSRVERGELRAQKEIVKVELKLLQEELKDSHPLGTGGDEPERSKISEARAILAEIDRRIGQLNRLLNDPENCLDHVADVLIHPRDSLKPETVTLRLNPMGIKVRQGSCAAFDRIELSEIELRKGVKRIAVVVKLQRPLE